MWQTSNFLILFIDLVMPSADIIIHYADAIKPCAD